MKDKRKDVINERRFECQKCGFCCLEMTLIYPSAEDIKNIAEYLNISEITFAIRYLQEIYDPYTNTYVIAFKTKFPDVPNGCIFVKINFVLYIILKEQLYVMYFHGTTSTLKKKNGMKILYQLTALSGVRALEKVVYGR